MCRDAGREGYRHLQTTDIKAKACELTSTDEPSIPSDLIDLLDDDIDEDLMQAETDKAATPAERLWSEKELARDMDRTRPQNLLLQRDSDANRDVSASRNSAFSDTSVLRLQTGSNLIDQFKSEYIPTVFHMSLPWCVGGPDFSGGKIRYRRGLVDDAPFLSLKDFTSMMPARVESQIRWDWELVPAVYSLNFASEVNLSTSLAIKRVLNQGRLQTTWVGGHR